VPTSVEEGERWLYGLPLTEFVTSRDASAKELRVSGHKELAAAVKALRKPSVLAAELNRVIRADPSGIDSIVGAAEALRAAQGSTDRSTFVELQTAYRDAVSAIANESKTHRVEVGVALQAAATNADHEAALRAGTFQVVPIHDGGFSNAGDSDGTVAAKRRSLKPASATASTPQAEQAAHRAALVAASAELEAARKALAATTHELDDARSANLAADAAIVKAKRQLAEAVDASRRAKVQVKGASQAELLATREPERAGAMLAAEKASATDGS
jgi:hypothetical protein